MTEVEDRRKASATKAEGVIERRKGPETRRKFPRWKTLKGGQIMWPTGGPIECLIRNLSEGGACLEVHAPIPHDKFDLVFESNGARYSCQVVWREPPRLGVEFL